MSTPIDIETRLARVVEGQKRRERQAVDEEKAPLSYTELTIKHSAVARSFSKFGKAIRGSFESLRWSYSLRSDFDGHLQRALTELESVGEAATSWRDHLQDLLKEHRRYLTVKEQAEAAREAFYEFESSPMWVFAFDDAREIRAPLEEKSLRLMDRVDEYDRDAFPEHRDQFIDFYTTKPSNLPPADYRC